jgi:uncharacterized membrane protein YebE (DUF533 family)
MMTAAQRAMTTWVGALAKGGVVDAGEAAAGEAVAAFVVGEEPLAELRSWLADADEATAARERRAAIEACIHMAHADRTLHPEESHLLSRLVATSGLGEDDQDELVAAVHEPPSIEGIGERLTQPVLRELILALAWELALSDGRVASAEEGFYGELAGRLGVSEDRAEEIRAAVGERLE